MSPFKVIIIQRICPHYMVPVLQRLAKVSSFDLQLYYGYVRNRKYKKLRNAHSINGFKAKKLFTLPLFFSFQGRSFKAVFNPSVFVHLLRDKPDVIICEGESNLINNIFIVVFAKLFHTPYIWWGLGRVRNKKPSIFRKLFGPLIKYMLRNSAGVLAYSTFAKKFYSSYGIDKHKIYVAYNCVDTEKVKEGIAEFQPLVEQKKEELGLKSKKVILFVGSFTEEKKIENLVLAYQIIKADYPNTALLLVGDGETKDAIKNLVREKKLEDVVFAGQKIEDVSLYFLLSDIFVLPGEGGLAINQAMAHGLPIITVPADGTELDMVINKKNGFIVEGDNVNALADAILKVVSDDSLTKRMGENSRKLVREKFNIHAMINTIVECVNYSLHKQ